MRIEFILLISLWWHMTKAAVRVVTVHWILFLLSIGTFSSELFGDTPREKSLRLPDWIWSTDSRRSSEQSPVFERSFVVGENLTSAEFQLATDFARCRVLLNQNQLIDVDAYAPRVRLNVLDQFRPGENVIRLLCEGEEGPSAIAATLVLSFADGNQETIGTDPNWNVIKDDQKRQSAVSFGRVVSHLWEETTERISAFDDYEQWRQAGEKNASPVTFSIKPGFEFQLIRSAEPNEGSWVSMAFAPDGKLTIAKEEKGLLSMELSVSGDRVVNVETVDDSLLEVRGLLYAHESLYANANNSKGMYRLRDSTGDGRLDDVRLLREFPGSVGHGRNDLALGPDGMIYSIHGDAVDLPHDEIVDRTSPLGAEAGDGRHFPQGHLIRTDKEGKRWELVARGLRNPFGIDFNDQGDVFTYDADNEYDMGSPWYRPTRINLLFSGADFGWRKTTNGAWPPYFPDRSENAPPMLDVGKGSPTAIKSGRDSSFPEPYRRAMFILDWAYGRVLACHSTARGAGYRFRVEQFLKARPLNVTDLDLVLMGACT